MSTRKDEARRQAGSGEAAKQTTGTVKRTGPPGPAQHSRRPDRYRLNRATTWPRPPGADAADLLARLWTVRRRP